MIKPLKKVWDVNYSISVYGITQSDGVPTVTSQMIRDKVIGVLEHALAEGWIKGYNVSAEINNLRVAKKVMKRSKKV